MMPGGIGRKWAAGLGVVGGIPFLVDTGADRTILMPDDWILPGLDYSQLTGSTDIGGVGGSVTFQTGTAFIAFVIPGEVVHAYSIEIAIAPDGPDYREIPSLLGRVFWANGKWSITPSKTFWILKF